MLCLRLSLLCLRLLSLRLLLCNKTASAKVKNWLLAGGTWADALAGLHQGVKSDVLGGRV